MKTLLYALVNIICTLLDVMIKNSKVYCISFCSYVKLFETHIELVYHLPY